MSHRAVFIWSLIFWMTGFDALPAHGQKPANLTETRLPNGLTVVTVTDPSVPLVTIEIAVKNGAFTEPPELDGLSHLYEHMFFKGNKVIPNQQAYLKEVRRLGMVFNATTGEEMVNYFFTLHKRNLENGVTFMKNALLHPLFDLKELNKERAVVISEYDSAESQPMHHLRRAMGKKLWYKHWSRKNALGERSVIEKATPAQMRLIQKLYYQPSNSALILAGDVTHDDALALARKVFGPWRGHPVKLPVVKHPPLRRHEVVFTDKKVKSVTWILAFHGPDLQRDVPATHAADVFSFIMRQSTSTLQKALVNKGLALRTAITYVTRRYVGPIYLYLTTHPEKAIDALKAVMGEIASWDQRKAYTDEQLSAAKTLLAVDDLYGREQTSEFCHTLSHWWASAGLRYYFEYIPRLKKTTRADINRFIRRYVKNRPMVVGLLMDKDVRGRVGITEEKIRSLLPRIRR